MDILLFRTTYLSTSHDRPLWTGDNYMVHIGKSCSFLIAVIVVLLIAVPVTAYSVAMYGTGAGLDPSLHTDKVTVIRSIPGSAGSDLDNAVDNFTQPSVDVIVLGGDGSFSPSTAAKIETAVAGGKVLVVAFPNNRLLDASLPATNGGTTSGGRYIEIANPTAKVTKDIFANLPDRFSAQGAVPDKEQAVERSGATIFLADDTGMPALLSKKYGKGTVIEWTTSPVPAYMTGEQADIIVDRMITQALPAPVVVPTTMPITVPSTLIPEPTTIPATNLTQPLVTPQPPLPSATTGDFVVYSSPLGASILIDGIYYGVTPANLTSIPQGNHILRLALSGYYDYEGTIYIVPGQTAHAFGTLPPLNQAAPAATAVPIIIPVAAPEPTTTVAKGLLENSSVIVAIIGVITASVAAGATIFTHVAKVKKEGKE
jgi:hypothetical protein